MQRKVHLPRKGRLERFIRLDATQRHLLVEAAILLIMARLCLLIMPFRCLARTIGHCVTPSHPTPLAAIPHKNNPDADIADTVRWAIKSACRHLPVKLVCFPRAIAASWMLQRRKLRPVLHLGTKFSSNTSIEAHAWLDCHGIPVTGYPLASDFNEVAKFQ